MNGQHSILSELDTSRRAIHLLLQIPILDPFQALSALCGVVTDHLMSKS